MALFIFPSHPVEQGGDSRQIAGRDLVSQSRMQGELEADILPLEQNINGKTWDMPSSTSPYESN